MNQRLIVFTPLGCILSPAGSRFHALTALYKDLFVDKLLFGMGAPHQSTLSQLLLIPGGVSFMLSGSLIRALGLTCGGNRHAEISDNCCDPFLLYGHKV